MQTDPRWNEPSQASATRRRGRPFRWIALIGLAMIVGGFFVFAESVQNDDALPERDADGIVVFTGGASRIEDAVDLLAAGRGKRLLISGVHPGTTADELVRMNPEFEQLLACCIDLGHEAENTVGNAIETGRWARERGFTSLLIVTSSWHMPRALVELEQELPSLALIPYPVFSQRMREEPWWSDADTIRLLIVEYAKLLAARVRVHLDPARFGDRASQS